MKKARVTSTKYTKEYATHKNAMNARKGDLLVAHLVESKRIDGKPRQKVLAYLGSIRVNRLTTSEDQLHFWRHAQAAFKKAKLTSEQKQAMDVLLLRRVAKPSPEMIADIDYIREHKAVLEAMPKEVRANRTTPQLANIIREIEKGHSIKVRIPMGNGMEQVFTMRPPSKAQADMQSFVDDWIHMFPMAYRDATGETREKLLQQYKEIVGKSYQP